MDIIYMGTPDFALPGLEKLAAEKMINLKGVVTQPDRPRGRGQRLKPSAVKEKALELGLEIFQPADVNEPGFLNRLRGLKPELIVVVAFGQKLGEELLTLPGKGCINLHASLLPLYRGSSPVHQAIIDGRRETGVTTMYLDEGWDSGDIIYQQKVVISEDDTAGTLHDRLAETGGELLLKTVRAIREGKAPRTSQDDSAASYAFRLQKDAGWIDWGSSAEEVFNHVRGVNPWPGAFTSWQGETLKIWQVEAVGAGRWGGLEPEQDLEEYKPGEIAAADEESGILVKTGEGLIRLRKVQLPGKKQITDKEFLRGYNIKSGERLG